MCYPCTGCGQCGILPAPKLFKCPKCGIELNEERPTCPTCGWSLPLPPGQASPPKSAADTPEPGRYLVISEVRTHIRFPC